MTRGVIIAAALAIAAPAAAQAPTAPTDAKAQAQQLAASAKAHFDKGEYDGAIADYREAYRLVPSPGLLYNLAQAYRLAGDCAKAAEAYRDYLRLAPDSPYKATVEQNLTAADACTKAAAPAPAPTPAPIPVPVPTPTPTPTATKTTTVEPRRSHRTLAFGLAGGGAVVALAGAYFAVDAGKAQQDVADFYAHGGAWADIADANARGHRDQALAIGGLALGGVAIAAGVTVYLLDRGDERAIAIVPARGGGEVVASWRW